jgi:hypothetical protein
MKQSIQSIGWERTAAMRLHFDGEGLQATTVTVASELPSAVAHSFH